MRLPADAALIVIPESDAEPLLAVWRQERLPVFALADGGFAGVADELDAIGATTLVLSAPDAAAARAAAALGYRVFVVADAPFPDPETARAASLETAIQAALKARGRERWRAARQAALLASDAASAEG